MSSALPAGLARALDWLDAHPDEPFDLSRLAFEAGVRPRTLEMQFRRDLESTPLGWVRRMRLARTRRELLAARAPASVTTIALDNGFRELGRFAGHYRKRFGERPSETLAVARAGLAAAFRRDEPRCNEPQRVEAERVTRCAVGLAFTVGRAACDAALELVDEAEALAGEVPRTLDAKHAGVAASALPAAIAAWCHGQRAAHGFGKSPESDRREALQRAGCAVREAPNDPMVLALASGANTLVRRLSDAERLAERALAIDPWLPWAWIRRGWLSAYAGDYEGALRELRTTLELMPREPLRHLAFIGIGCARFGAGDFAAAARWIDDALVMEPASFWAERVLVAAAMQTSARDEGRRRARGLLRKDPSLTVQIAQGAWPFPTPFVDRLADGLARAGVPRG
ncbi:MAG TPA: helix-turn-helix domain-containing protein [Casimicrobiaceae bacterium]